MQYSVNHNGVTCMLPTYTRSVKKKIDSVNDQLSKTEIPLDARLDAEYAFLLEMVGEETLSKVLGSDDLDEIDLNDMSILYLKITKEYDRPVEEYNRPEMPAEVKKALQDIDKVAKNVTTIQSMAMKK